LGYFVCDSDSNNKKKVFNKTVGLRDTWSKQQPKTRPQAQQTPTQKPVDALRKLGKKYMNLPKEKQQEAKAKLIELAVDISPDDLKPLFATAVKKTGTRMAVLIVLEAQEANGLSRSTSADEFIKTAQEDKNEKLATYAQTFIL
jgi:glutaminyl-tRNA synthetase